MTLYKMETTNFLTQEYIDISINEIPGPYTYEQLTIKRLDDILGTFHLKADNWNRYRKAEKIQLFVLNGLLILENGLYSLRKKTGLEMLEESREFYSVYMYAKQHGNCTLVKIR